MTVLTKTDLLAAGRAIDAPWSPRIAGDVNDAQVKIARFDGAFDWHAHADEDEAFLVLDGRIAIAYRDADGAERDVELGPGEFVVVPRGVVHRPRSIETPNVVVMFEPATTLNTGDAISDRTVAAPQRL